MATTIILPAATKVEQTSTLVGLTLHHAGNVQSVLPQSVGVPFATPAVLPTVVTPRDVELGSPITTYPSNQVQQALPYTQATMGMYPTMDIAAQVSSDGASHDEIINSSLPKRSGTRLNKFVRRLHDMLQSEIKSGVVEWRRGLLVLHSTDAFAKTILPKYFNTRNFKTFRRQLNYYGFVHVRSFSTTGSTTTALWVNQDLAKNGTANISSVLMLKRVEPCESAKTAEGRRVRKKMAVSTVEEDIGVSAKTLQMEQIRSLGDHHRPPIPQVVHCCSSQLQQAALPLPSLLLPKATTTDELPHRNDEEPDNESAANLLLMLSKGTCMS